jgi:aryl-alcohol dehydrogenase-like predicted oxidoreductase
MEMRFLGQSGLRVSTFSFGTMTFGTQGDYFSQLGDTNDIAAARRLVEVCLEAGVNLFDTSDAYSDGGSEEMLGKAIHGYRDQVVLATKVFNRMGPGANDIGLSRAHIVRACEASLRRLGTDYIDLYQAHGFDALTPLDETLAAFDQLVQSGKVRYIGCSNYSAWHLMKALAVSEIRGFERYISQQVYYSLIGRELEFELVPLSLDQNVGILVWSPMAGGFLSGKYRRGQGAPADARRSRVSDLAITIAEDKAYDIVDVVCDVAEQRGVSAAEVALNWLLRKPGVTSVIVGARTEEQLHQSLHAAAWQLSDEEMARLNQVSALPPIYPYWHQQRYAAPRNPSLPDVR